MTRRETMKKYALIGRSLAYSQSARIHSIIGDYEYVHVEVEDASNLESVLANAEFDGFNVTTPYKEAVIPYLDELSSKARRIGAVNTIKRLPDGRLKGYNTDIVGFRYMVMGKVEGKKCVILGSGGAARSCAECLADLGAEKIVVVSRNPGAIEESYRESFNEGFHGSFEVTGYNKMHLHYDAEVIINATPVGMSPQIERSPLSDQRLSVRMFTNLELAVDLIYNPYRTKFLQDARRLTRCNTKSGLDMLIVQAISARDIWKGETPEGPDFMEPDVSEAASGVGTERPATDWRGSELGDERNDLFGILKRKILENQLNVIAVGMPGSGKTTIFRRYAYEMGLKFIDTDELTEAMMGDSIQNVLMSGEVGIEYFRAMEHEALKKACENRGAVIATGGGTILNPLNRDLLRSNGIVVYMKRPLDLLAVKDRPLSLTDGVSKLFGERDRIYRSVSDLHVLNTRIFGKGNAYNHDLKGFVYYISRKIGRYLREIADNKWT